MFHKILWLLFIINYNKMGVLGHASEYEVNHATTLVKNFTAEKLQATILTSALIGKSSSRKQYDKARSKKGGIRKREIILIDDDFDDAERKFKRELFEGSGTGLIPVSVKAPNFEALRSEDTTGIQVTDMQDGEDNSSLLDLNIITENIKEGSADYELTHLTDFTSENEHTIITTETSIPMNETVTLCMSSVCSAPNDLLIKVTNFGSVMKGANLTFECVSSNNLNTNFYLYKMNASVSTVLTDTKNQSSLEYNIIDATEYHSGIYRCVKWSEKYCCYQEVHIYVCEVPVYKYHLLTIGIIAAVLFVTCILIGIWTNWSISKYEKRFKDKNVQALIS